MDQQAQRANHHQNHQNYSDLYQSWSQYDVALSLALAYGVYLIVRYVAVRPNLPWRKGQALVRRLLPVQYIKVLDGYRALESNADSRDNQSSTSARQGVADTDARNPIKQIERKIRLDPPGLGNWDNSFIRTAYCKACHL